MNTKSQLKRPPKDDQQANNPVLKKSKITLTLPNNAPKQQLLTKFISFRRQFSTGDGQIQTDNLLICSWNINGFRRIINTKQLQDYFNARKPDILCLNEIKITQEMIEKEKLTSWIPPEYTCYFNSAKMKKAYSGVAIITRVKPMSVQYGMGVDQHDLEGRLVTIEFQTFYLVAVYVPFSGEEFKRLPYRINEWDPALRKYLSDLKTKKPVICCGDFNVAHQSLDMWEESGKYIGSSPPERESFGKLLQTGFVDTFRYVYPDVRKYTWWNLWKGNRTKNLGRRFDYIIASKDAVGGIKDAFVNNDIHGSDHCPVELLFNPNFSS